MQRDGQYRGVTYRVESMPIADGHFIGRYRLLDTGRRRQDTADHQLLGGGPSGRDAFGDSLSPGPDPTADQSASAMNAGGADDAGAMDHGTDDVVHPSLDPAWATENEALTYATEAACHAIEVLQLGRPQAQGRGSGSSWRRMDTLGQ